MSRDAYLVLENKTVFKGKSFGYEAEVTGEVVFTTAMTGYLETLTDPSYYGQIVAQTFPLVGNYGIIPADFESEKLYPKAYIVREWCQQPSNFRCEGELDTFLKENKVPGIYGIDTRKLTKIVRESGVMNAKICYSDNFDDSLFDELKGYKIVDAISEVTCKEEKTDEPENAKRTVVVYDFGTKNAIKHELMKRGCKVITVPATTRAERIFEINPDGVLLSSGPGDPSENKDIIAEVAKICEKKIPVFGICTGHLILALSQGAKIEKLKYGHRGENQPAVSKKTGRVYPTSQSHGYAVVGDSLPKGANVSYENANDLTCEGVSYDYMPAFSVQFHPEAAGGPLDTQFVFDEFIELMDGGKKDAVK